ncbi:MAG: BatA domain-containing protein, partial [Planctomycetes bacterium]|nr:BatA domain-containing protein [Planctomycetota bacterium]
MGFLSAAFLLGLAAIAAPVAIHLIHRQRYPERAFTTLRFFDKTVKHNVIQRRLIDRVLLALRIAALAALALGLARPFTGAGLGEKRLSLVIVLDNSPSMGRVRDGATLFARAQEAAGMLAAQLQ